MTTPWGPGPSTARCDWLLAALPASVCPWTGRAQFHGSPTRRRRRPLSVTSSPRSKRSSLGMPGVVQPNTTLMRVVAGRLNRRTCEPGEALRSWSPPPRLHLDIRVRGAVIQASFHPDRRRGEGRAGVPFHPGPVGAGLKPGEARGGLMAAVLLERGVQHWPGPRSRQLQLLGERRP